MCKSTALARSAFVATIRHALTRRVALLTLLTLGACVGGDSPLTPDLGSGPARLFIRPDLSLLVGSAFEGLPINRIRLTATNVAGTDTLGVQIVTVVDDPEGWRIPFEAPATSEPFVVIIELINLTDGTETVEFSAKTAPITVDAAGTGEVMSPPPVPGPPGNLNVSSVSIVAPGAGVMEGDSVQLQAVIVGGSAGARAIWRSLDTGVATVGENGVVRLLRDGTARIVAQAGSALDTITVIGLQRPVSVRITPDSVNAASLGQIVNFTATVLDARGAPISGSSFTWTIDNAAIAEHTGNGSFRTTANGSTRVRATAVGITGLEPASAALVVAQRPARINVIPGSYIFTAVGLSQTFTTEAVDENGNLVPGAVAITWSSSAPAIASVTSEGVVTARGAGDAVITATAGTASGTADVAVRQTVASIQIDDPAAPIAALGSSTQLVVTARDANNNVIAVPTGITFTSADPAIATVSETGAVTAVANGTTRITATAGAATDFADVVVRQAVSAVTIEPAAAVIPGIGSQTQLTAIGRDAGGHLVADATFTWNSSAPSVATVDANGSVTATGFGNTTISAASGAATGNAAIQVVPPTISVTPELVTLGSVGAHAIVAVAIRDQAGEIIAGAVPEWTSLDPAVATASGNDVVATGAGTTQLIASFGGVSDTITVTVTQTAATMSLNPSSVTAPAGEDVQLVATVLDTNGNVIRDPVIVFTSADPSIATVDDNGVVHTVSMGSTTVTARSGTVTANVPVTVTTPGALPDLLIIAASLTPPGDVYVGVPVTGSFTIKSAVAASGASSAVVVVYDAETEAPVVTIPVPIPAIAAGGTYTVNIPVTPQPDWPSEVYIQITLDALGAVAESNEANNLAQYPIEGTISVIGPDPGDARLEVSETFVMIDGAETLMLSAIFHDGEGGTFETEATWSSSNEDVVTVSPTGLVTGGIDGFALVQATAIVGGTPYVDAAGVRVGPFPTPEGTTITWIGPHDMDASSSWNVPSNWLENRVPNASDRVFIPDCTFYYDGFGNASECTHPVLSSSVTIDDLSTGFIIPFFECEYCGYIRASVAADAARIDTPDGRRQASMFRHEAAKQRAQRVVNRTRPTPRDVVSQAARASLRSDVRMASSMASSMDPEYPEPAFPYYHIDFDGHTLTLNGTGYDFSILGSTSEPGLLILNGSGPVAFNSLVQSNVQVSGEYESVFLGVYGDLHVASGGTLLLDTAEGEGEAFVEGNILVNGTLSIEDDMELSAMGSVTADGGEIILDDYGTYFSVGTTLSLVNNAHLEIAEGEVSVGNNEYCYTLSGNFSTASGSTFAMRDYYSYFWINGHVDIAGGSTAGMLEDGEMYIYGNMTVGGPSNQAFAPTGNHETSFGYAYDHVVTMANPGFGTDGNHFGDFGSYSSDEITFTTPIFVEGYFDAYVGSGMYGTELNVMEYLYINNPETFHVDELRIWGDINVSSSDPFDTNLTMLGETQYIYGDLHVAGNMTVDGADVYTDYVITVDDTFTITNNGMYRVGYDASLEVNDFITSAGGKLAMQGISSLIVNGDAVFGGGSVEGGLDEGSMYFHGDLNVTTAVAFHAGPLNTVYFAGEEPHTISVVAPGLDAGQNHFGSVNFGADNNITLTTDIALSGEVLSEEAGSSIVGNCPTGCLLSANGADIWYLDLTDIRLRVTSEDDIDLNYIDFHGPFAQLAIVRSFGGPVNIQDPDFTDVVDAGSGFILILDGEFDVFIDDARPNPIPAGRVQLLNRGDAILDINYEGS